VQALFLYG